MVCATWEFDARKSFRVRFVLNVEKKTVCAFKQLVAYLPEPLFKKSE